MTSARRSLLVLVAALAVLGSACQPWASRRADPTNAAFNAGETTLGLDDAGAVPVRFTADLGPDTGRGATPVLTVDRVYAPIAGAIAAFDRAGVEGCGGTPTTCTPIWRGDLGGRTVLDAATVVGTTLYVTAGFDPDPSGVLAAFDLTVPADRCPPAGCAPAWTAPGVTGAAPVVVDGLVIAAWAGQPEATSVLAAFDAAGQASCTGTPRTCTPLRTFGQPGDDLGATSSPAVADGTLFATTFAGELLAFDVTGASGCTGAPSVCSPRWIGETLAEPHYWPLSPVVVDGQVYVAFDALGPDGEPYPWGAQRTLVTGYPTDPELGGCPLRTAPGPAYPSCPAAFRAEADGTTIVHELAGAYGHLYLQLGQELAPATTRAVALDLADPACRPGPCDAAWSAPLSVDARASSPIVANHTLFVGAAGATLALDAHGVDGCAGSPTTCTPVTFVGVPGATPTGSAIGVGVLATVTVGSGATTLLVSG